MHHQPAIILLDDLDEMAKHITDVQKEASGEASVHTRNAQGTNRQTDRDRQSDRRTETDRQTDGQRQTETNRQMDKHCVNIVIFLFFQLLWILLLSFNGIKLLS